MNMRPGDIAFEKTQTKVAAMSEADVRIALVTAVHESRRVGLERALQSLLVAMDALRTCTHEPDVRVVFDKIQHIARNIGDLK